MIDFKALFKQAIEAKGSDIHLQGGHAPILRVHGSLVRAGKEAVGSEELKQQITQMLPAHLKGDFREEANKGLDFSFTDAVAGRFRCRAVNTVGAPGITMRSIPTHIASVSDLARPAAATGVRAA